MRIDAFQRSRWTAACLLAALVAAATALPAQSGPGDPITVRSFEVRFRALADAADLIAPVLTDDGTVKLVPRLKRLVVEDRASALAKVAALLEEFDTPPRNVEVTMILFLGSDTREERKAPASPHSVFSDEVQGIIEGLRDVMKWANYEPLGARSVSGIEGNRVVADLSSEYRVVLDLGSVSTHDGSDYVKFDKIDLQRLVPELRHVHSTSQIFRAGTLSVVGAAKSPDAAEALFLVMQVETE